MSGFEIAGIVLGIFPILVDTTKDLRCVFRHVKTWLNFENEFETLIFSVQRENIAYIQNVEILLGGIDISEADQEELRKNPDSRLWTAPHLQMTIQKRLRGGKWDWVKFEMSKMIDALRKLRSILPSAEVRGIHMSCLISFA